jgi:hypothetical protein
MNNEPQDLVRFQPARSLTPVMNLALAKSRLAEFQDFISKYMIEGEDFGLIPGTQKKSLWKPGADKLCEIYGLADSYRVIDRLVDFDRGLFDYEIECTLSRDGFVVATGLGSCSSFEGKYRWRDSKQKCPECGKESIIKGKEEYGGGFICFAKKGGCGAKFAETDERIIGQVMGQVENDDIATLKNTILKMAKKRAKVDATLAATRSSGVFTQDIGDPEPQKQKTQPIQQPQRTSQPQNAGKPENGKLITEGQLKRLWAKGYAAIPNVRRSLEQKEITDIVAAFGYQHANEIKMADYDAIIAAIEVGHAPTSDPEPK